MATHVIENFIANPISAADERQCSACLPKDRQSLTEHWRKW